MDAITIAHLTATLMMAGLIWTVQLVVYPQFAAVGASEFGAYHERHMARISLIVGPLIALEALTAAVLLFSPPAGALAWLPVAGMALVVANLAVTAFVQVPLHRKLARSRDEGAIRSLVRTNWIRTATWSARVAVAILLLAGTAPS